jgi:hypothetical protein
MFRVRLLAGFVVVATTLVAPKFAHAQKIKGAEFFSHTNDDDKDHDTGVWVKVVTANEQTKIASVENAANCGNSCHFNDNTDHTIGLRIDSPNLTRAECENFKFKIGTKANKNDKWKFRGKIILRFDGGQTLTREFGNTELNSRGGHFVEFPNWVG